MVSPEDFHRMTGIDLSANLKANEALRIWQKRLVFLTIGSIAAGFAFGWVAGVAAFFLFLSILPNDFS